MARRDTPYDGALRRANRAPALMLAAILVATARSAGAETVELLRDVHGVVHVFAATDEGAMFGAGYAAARDRMFQMHRTRRTVQGRLAELLGTVGSGSATSVASDRSFRLRRVYEHCQAAAASLDPRSRTLLQAYADGVNRWIDEGHPLLPLFDGQTPEPWAPADCIAVWDRITELFGGSLNAQESRTLHQLEALGGDCELWEAAYAQPVVIDEAAAVMQLDQVPPATLQAICDYAASVGYPCAPGPGGAAGAAAAPPGARRTARGPMASPRAWSDEQHPSMSHAWVMGGDRLVSGSTTLVSDPQTEVMAPSIWYESHVRGASFDVRGLTFAGCPGILIGFSRDVAWGVTALGVDLCDTWRLAPSPDGTQYQYDGAWHPIHARDDTIRVKQPGGGFSLVPIRVRWTDLGPVVTDLMQDVRAGEEYVARAVPWTENDGHTVAAALAMLSATDRDLFRQAIAGWRAPGVHMVFGDRTGRIGYWTLAATPVRTPAFCLAGRAAGDGSTSAAQWVDHVPLAVRPHVLLDQGGALYSANHVAVGSWYPLPLQFTTGGTGHGSRGWRLHELLVEEAPAVAVDGYAFGVHGDDTNPHLREIARWGLHLRDQPHDPPVTLSTEALAALGELEGWVAAGARSRLDQPAYAAAHGMNLQFRLVNWPELVQLWGSNNLSHLLKDVKARLDQHTPGAPAHFSPDELEFVDFALASGWNAASAAYGPPASWQSGITDALGDRLLPYHQTLEHYGSLDPAHDFTVSGVLVPDPGTIRSQWGQSMTVAVALVDPDRAQALHPPGQSEDAASPFFDNEVQGWVEGKLRSAPLARTRVESMLHSTTALDFQGVTGVTGGSPGARLALSCRPNPTLGDVEIEMTSAGGPAELEVIDVGGRRMMARAWAALPHGRQAARWDGRDPAGRAAPPGVYLVRLRSGPQSVTRRIVRLANP